MFVLTELELLRFRRAKLLKVCFCDSFLTLLKLLDPRIPSAVPSPVNAQIYKVIYVAGLTV